MPECYFCGSTDDIEEHHILPQRFEGSDKESNTVDLCHKCHWKLERLYNKEFWEAIGVDDPRATKESHVTCSVHGCMEQAIGRFHTKRGALVYRCDQHRPGNEDNDDNGYESEEEGEKGDQDWLDKMVTGRTEEGGYTQQLDYGFNELLDGGPVSKEKLHDMFVGRLFERASVLEQDEHGRVMGARLSTGFSVYSARYEPEEGEWVIEFEGEIEREE